MKRIDGNITRVHLSRCKVVTYRSFFARYQEKRKISLFLASLITLFASHNFVFTLFDNDSMQELKIPIEKRRKRVNPHVTERLQRVCDKELVPVYFHRITFNRVNLWTIAFKISSRELQDIRAKRID